MARAGKLRERVAFERLSGSVVDAYGNTSTGWAALTSRQADMMERPGKEAVTGGALDDRGTATLRLRKDSVTETITAADRVIARGTTWAIKNVIQLDSKGAMLEMLLEKGVAP